MFTILNRHYHPEPGKTFYYVVLRQSHEYYLVMKETGPGAYGLEAFPTIEDAVDCFKLLIGPVINGTPGDPKVINKMGTFLALSPVIIGFAGELEELMRYVVGPLFYKHPAMHTGKEEGSLLKLKPSITSLIVLDVVAYVFPDVQQMPTEGKGMHYRWVRKIRKAGP